MPNWCSNILTVSGPTFYVDRFIDKAKSKAEDDPSPLSLESLLPVPANKQDDWYNWCTANWGTKWDVDAIITAEYVNGDRKSVTYRFDSAWSPPVELISSIVDDFVNLYFRLAYAEGGMGFIGVAEGDAVDGFMDWCEDCHDYKDFAYRAESIGFDGYIESYKDYVAWEAEQSKEGV